MTYCQRCVAVSATALALLSSLTGCATSRPSQFGMSFLPAAPQPDTPHSVEPGNVGPDQPLLPLLTARYSSPSFSLPASLISARDLTSNKPSEAEWRMQRAESRFQEGKRLYQEGDMVGARREFDQAIDSLLETDAGLADRAHLERKLEELTQAIYRMDVEGLGAGEQEQAVGFEKAPLEDILDMTFPVDPGMRPKVSQQVQATVSQLPLVVNDQVLGYINFFNGERGRRTLLAGLRRAGRYKDMISRILREENVPQELIYLAQAESGFMPRAVSHKAAAGMWQFMQDRGREYGLRQSSFTDDRLDPEKATRAAARHLRDLHQKFGDWHLAVAAYNCGDGCVDRAVQRTGYADYWELRRRKAIPRETTDYVPIILAMTIMAKNPAQYGLTDVALESAWQYETLQLDAPANIGLLADLAHCSVSELRELNPSLLGSLAPAGFTLRMPKGTQADVVAGLRAVPLERRSTWRLHRVNSGDTLASIARQYSLPTETILEANSHTEEEMEVGSVLVIPASQQKARSASKLKSKAASSRGKRFITAKGKGRARVALASRRKGRSVVKTASHKTSTKKVAYRKGSLRASR